jgi:DNA-binding NarL/FixJ family response regulator
MKTDLKIEKAKPSKSLVATNGSNMSASPVINRVPKAEELSPTIRLEGSTKSQAEVDAAAMKGKKRVLLVDDHPIVRQGLAQLINQETEIGVCGQAEDAHKALEAIGTLKPDIAIVDISLKTISGIELIKNIKIQYPQLPVLVLSMHDESLYAERALRAGAKGYIMKREVPEKLLGAIHRILRGEMYVSDKMGVKIFHHFVDGPPEAGGSSLDRLSDRELEVFQLIGKGRGTRQIAEALHLSIKTIESYREHIKKKLLLKSGSELVQHAVQWVENEHSRG